MRFANRTLLWHLLFMCVVFSSIAVTAVASEKELARDAHYIAYSTDTVVDSKHGLMWAAQDNGVSLDWLEAEKYCLNYNGGGYTDWRLPTFSELLTLFDSSRQNAQGFHLTPLITLSARQLWSADNYVKPKRAKFKPAAVYVRFDSDYSAGKALVGFKLKRHEILFRDAWISHRVLPVRSIRPRFAN